MKQMPYLIHEEADYLAMQWEVRVALGEMEVSQLLISVFGTERDEESTEVIMRRLHRDFPNAEILACMAAETVIEGSVACDGILVGFSAFESAQVEILGMPADKMTPKEMGQKLLARLDEIEHPKAVGVLLSDVTLDITDFLAEASKCSPEIKFFGGISDEGRMGTKGKFFLTDGSFSSGLALVIYSGENLHVDTFYSFGWRPLGRAMTITKLETPYIVQEIDRRPAVEVYEKYLDIHNSDNLFWDALTFPICAQRDGEMMARHPRSARSDGALVFGADFRLGEQVRLTYGDPEGIIKYARVLRKEIQAFQPQGIFIISCVARWLLLQHDVAFELEACRGVAPDFGFYGYGEFVRKGKELVLANMNLVAVCLREGEVGTPREYEEMGEERQPTSQTSIMRHLVYFVNAMSHETEQTTARLRHIAKTDWLTDLMNQGEMEKVIRKGLSYVQSSGQQLAVIMLDLDDFKALNDKYGHDVGDQILQRVANILRGKMRKVDSPGRWGSDEFFAILIGTTVEKAYTLAEEIRQEISSLEIIPGGENLTVSLGLTVSGQEDDETDVFKRADKALHMAKRKKGKDCTTALDETGLKWVPKKKAAKKEAGAEDKPKKAGRKETARKNKDA